MRDTDKPWSPKYCRARSARKHSRTSENVTPSEASRRADVRWLRPSLLAISEARAFPCGNRDNRVLHGRSERASVRRLTGKRFLAIRHQELVEVGVRTG